MGILSVVPAPDGFGGNSDGSVTDTEAAWEIVVDSHTENATTIAGQTIGTPNPPYGIALPTYLSGHPDDANQTARTLAFSQKDSKNWRVWLAKAQYSSKPLKTEEEEKFNQANPLLRAPEIDYAPLRYPKVISQDRDGDPLVNSALDEYDPQDRQVDAMARLINIKANIAPALPAWYLSLGDIPPVNEAAVVIDSVTYPAETLRLGDFRIGRKQRENAVEFRELPFTLEYQSNGWNLVLLDAGFHFIAAGSGANGKRPIKINGERPSTPQNLNGAGGVLPLGGVPQFNTFQVPPLLDFTQFPGVTAVP